MARNLKEGRSAKASERGAILNNQNIDSEFTSDKDQRREKRAEAGFSGVFGE